MTAIYFIPDADRSEEFYEEPTPSGGSGPPNEIKTYGLALLVLAMLVAVGEVAFRRDTASLPAPATPQNCTAVADPNARLACYDQVFDHAPSEPAKGANALLPGKL